MLICVRSFKKLYGSAVNAELMKLVPKAHSAPYAPPMINATHLFGDQAPKQSVAIKVRWQAISPVPSHWLKPARTQPKPMPVTTTANSARVIRPSINSGKTGRAPSLKLEIHLCESKLAQAQIAIRTIARNGSENSKLVMIPSMFTSSY